MRELLILSPCFYPSDRQALLMVESARAHDLPVQLYGIGEQFIPHGADAQVAKLCSLMEREKRANHALITDCRDVLFLANEFEIMGKYGDFPSDIVMSTENGCWPPDQEVVRHFFGKSRHGYDFINAGQYIGTWESIVAALKHFLENYRSGSDIDNSQGWWMKALMRGELRFDLDSECKIFQTMSGGADAQVKLLRDGRAFNAHTRQMPCSLHFNGNPSIGEPHRGLWNSLKQA